MNNSTLSQEQMEQSAAKVHSALELLRGLHWATNQAETRDDFGELQGLLLGCLPGLFRQLDDVSEILGNRRHGNFD